MDSGGIARLNCSVLTTAQNSRGFDSMPKLTLKVCIYLPGFEQGFLQSFYYKSVPTMQGIYLDFGKRKVNIPAIPWDVVANDRCIKWPSKQLEHDELASYLTILVKS